MKKIIDILAIVLPALIIVLGIARVFVKKTKGVNGLTMLFAILLLLVGLLDYYVFPDRGGSSHSGSKTTPLSVSKHSDAFNQSLENILTRYYGITAAFAKGDTLSVNRGGVLLQQALDSLRLKELEVDTLIYQTALQPYENAKAELASILTDPSLEEKRASFNILSNELFALVNIVKYDRARLYWLECEKAFGEGKAGNWLSATEEATLNPYGQEDCAELKDKTHFPGADSTKATTTPKEE